MAESFVKARIAVYGAGAMGTTLGALLARAGVKADLITRNKAHVAALKEKGAKVSGAYDFKAAVNALTPDEMQGEYDIIFLMTKQRENAVIAAYIGGYLKKDGVVCVMQNGLPEDSVAGALGKGRVLGCAVSYGATYISAGEVKLTSDKSGVSFAVGSPFAECPESAKKAVADILSLIGRTEIYPDFSGARWAKLIVNSAFSTLSALSGKTFGEIAKGGKYRRLALAMMREAATAARAQGVTKAEIQGHDLIRLFGSENLFKRGAAFIALPFAMKKHKNLVSGMYYDLSKGKNCDVDFVAGEVVRRAQSAGLKAPVTKAAVELVHSVERGKKQIGDNGELLHFLYCKYKNTVL